MNTENQKDSTWHKVRSTRFTGSRINELMGVKGLGLTGASYAFELACNAVFGYDESEQFESFDMKRGTELEPLAFRKFKELKEVDFMTVENCGFFAFGNDAGASPDGLVNKDAVLEIKCPRPTKFFNLISQGIEAIDKGYYDQMQMEMLCTNSQRCHFFNYIIYNGVEMWHEIIINRDEPRIELIKQRILDAVIIRDNYIKDLLTNKQF